MTALQELLDFLHFDKSHEHINEHIQVHDIVLKCQELLRKERHQIEHAFNLGSLEETFSNAKDFYETVYENSNE